MYQFSEYFIQIVYKSSRPEKKDFCQSSMIALGRHVLHIPSTQKSKISDMQNVSNVLELLICNRKYPHFFFGKQNFFQRK